MLRAVCYSLIEPDVVGKTYLAWASLPAFFFGKGGKDSLGYFWPIVSSRLNAQIFNKKHVCVHKTAEGNDVPSFQQHRL